jgi:hypothetical protein
MKPRDLAQALAHLDNTIQAALDLLTFYGTDGNTPGCADHLRQAQAEITALLEPYGPMTYRVYIDALRSDFLARLYGRIGCREQAARDEINEMSKR